MLPLCSPFHNFGIELATASGENILEVDVFDPRIACTNIIKK
jgi:hypothetical protein